MKRTILAVLLVTISLFPGCGSDPSEPESLSPWEDVSEHAIGIGGGTVENDELSIIVPPGAFETSATIVLQRATSSDFELEDPLANVLGNVYRLDGVPEFYEPLTVQLNFNPADLPADNACFVYLEEECFVSVEGDWVQRGRPLAGSVIDRTNGTVTALLPAYEAQANKDDIPILHNFLITSATAEEIEAVSSGGDFEIYWFRGQVDLAWVGDLVNALEEAKAKLEELGMQFTNSENDAIEVLVRPLKSGVDGEFVQSNRGINASYLKISPTIMGDLQKVTAGHELFHLLQMCYGACGHIFGYDYEWFCEAASTWFEPVFMDDPDLYPDTARANQNFIRQPLETEDLAHGYGASCFMTYVLDQFGDDAMKEIMIGARDQGRNGPGVAAMEKMLTANGTTLKEMFISFAQKYVTATTGHADWGTSDPVALILSPSLASRHTSLDLGDLSARHINTALNWDDPLTWGRLTIALNPDASEHVKGFIYNSERGGGPWVLSGELFPDDPYVILDFGRDNMTWTKVVVLRAEALAPFNQSESVTINYDFEPQDGFPVGYVGFYLRLEGTLVSGETKIFWCHFDCWNPFMISENTFEVDMITGDANAGWQRHDVFRATMDYTNQVVVSWFYRSEFENDNYGIHEVTLARGGQVGANWQNEVSAQYRLRGQDVCDGIIEMTNVRTETGEADEQLATIYCDISSRLEITIND